MIKSINFFFGFVLLFLVNAVHSQTAAVTFQVDMNNVTVSSDGVHIAGGFQGWDPSATLLTDDDSDGIYERTIDLPADNTYEFLFINGASWGSEEDVPPTCQVEVSGNHNRFVAVGADDTEVTYHICWESCAACGMTTVRFRVDMMHEEVSSEGVHVAGNFQGWNPSTSPLSDADGDGVWETWASFYEETIADGFLGFKFINGDNWASPNEAMSDQACADEFGNRILEFSDENIVLTADASVFEAPCFNSCESCVLEAQEDIQISAGGEVVICDGFFYDDGILGAVDGGPYTDQDYTITICPETDGDAIQVVFLAFDLQTNANPNNNDVLYVFDGDDTSAEMVGAGTNNSLLGVSFTASTFNPTGCLTFVFNSNNGATAGAAGWVGTIACVTPCTYPESGYDMTDPDPFEPGQPSVGVCPGQEVSFDGSSSMGDGVDLEYWIWNWGDGTVDSTTSALTSHSYEEPGEYLVSLVVADENNCTSVNLEVYQVLVSTIPIFNADFSSPLCTESPGFLDGNPVQSITWTALPTLAVSEELPMPDATGAWFESELYIDFFDDGQTLDDCDDLLGINALMEHSFVGDLTIQVECPDGTQVLIMENNTSGADDCSGGNDLNGYYLGEPDDFDGTTPNPGVGYWYTFTEDGEYLLDDAGNPDVTGNTIPAGEYGLCGDICDFVGCPLNGIWTFQVIDQWGADNGFLFEWGIDFNPEIVPDVTTFTPTIGADMDSSYWQVSSSTCGVESIDTDADYVDLMFDTPGEYEFVYTVTNNFSCTWDTTVVVEIIPGLGNSVTAGMDQIFCQDPVQLEGAFVGEEESSCSASEGSVNFCYGPNEYSVFTYCPDNPGDGTMMTIDFSSGGVQALWDAVAIFDGDSDTAPLLANLDGDLTGQTFTATNPDGCITIVITSDGWGSCSDGTVEEMNYCVSCGGQVECGYNWTWDPPTYLDDPFSPNPTVTAFDGQPIEYTLLVEPVGMPYCGTEYVVSVIPGFEYSVDFEEPSYLLTDGYVAVDINEPPAEGPWTLTLSEGGTLVQTVESNGGLDVFANLVSGTYELELSDTSGCVYYMDIVLSPPPAESNTVVDVIVNSEDHTLLEAAVGAAGLVDVLSGEGPFTVFAPTDAAFTALTAAIGITVDELLAIPNLADILLYHVVGAEAYSTDLSDGQEIETLLGENVNVSITADGVFINNAQVIVADIAADNGVVHVIDAVLLPPAPATNTVVDIIFNSPDHTMLEAAIGAAGLVDVLSGEGPFTVFAPTDAAFTALTAAIGITVDELLAIPNLADILLYHVVGAEAYSTDLSDGQEIVTLFGGDITVSMTAYGVFINDAQVIVADLAADNGVVHVIDAVILSIAGCTDVEAINFDLDANYDDGTCVYITYDCSSIGNEAWSEEGFGVFPDWQEAVHGVAWEGEWVLNLPETIVEPGSGVVYGVHHMDWTGLEGLPDWVETASYGLSELDANSQHCIAASGTPEEPGLHEITATGEVFISIFGQPFSIGNQSFSAWLEVAENPNPILGCTYSNAVNFVSFANDDDGSCLFAGCTDSTAGNFNPIATIDDGSCGEGCDPMGDSTCQADNDGDGIITVSDLLILLGEFGATCE